MFNEHIEDDGRLVFDHACRIGLEGIVAKRLDGACFAARRTTGFAKQPKGCVMPVKLRRPKKRVQDAAELEAWRTLFESGWDFFRDLGPFGLHTDEQARAAAPEAWRRLGRPLSPELEP